MLGGRGAAALTLGHCILGQSTESLHAARDHEHVHVRQYQRWGPFFLPAYLAWSAVLWFQGRDAYLENPFEVDAYTASDPNGSVASDRPTENPDRRKMLDQRDGE
jgi:hypothetical protein